MSEHKYFPPSVYVSFSELKDGETFTFRYGDRPVLWHRRNITQITSRAMPDGSS